MSFAQVFSFQCLFASKSFRDLFIFSDMFSFNWSRWFSYFLLYGWIIVNVVVFLVLLGCEETCATILCIYMRPLIIVCGFEDRKLGCFRFVIFFFFSIYGICFVTHVKITCLESLLISCEKDLGNILYPHHLSFGN